MVLTQCVVAKFGDDIPNQVENTLDLVIHSITLNNDLKVRVAFV